MFLLLRKYLLIDPKLPPQIFNITRDITGWRPTLLKLVYHRNITELHVYRYRKVYTLRIALLLLRSSFKLDWSCDMANIYIIYILPCRRHAILHVMLNLLTKMKDIYYRPQIITPKEREESKLLRAKSEAN